MSKRKRSSSPPQDSFVTSENSISIQRRSKKLKTLITQGTQTTWSALKLARGFERQKLSRRQKEASSEPHRLLKLREEVITLKQLDLLQKAQNHLLKQLVRTKRIRESPAFVQIYGDNPELTAVQSGAEANVLGRLFNSSPVKQVMPEIMDQVFRVLGLRSMKVREKEEQNANITTTNGTRDDTNYDDVPGPESSNLNNGRGREDNRPLLSSSEEEDDDDNDNDDEISSTSSNIIQKAEEGINSPPTVERQKPTKTTFLPSLNHTGYFSGSESDSNASYPNNNPTPHQRKNRRGQRARQQLAELKYGRNAKHLSNPKQQKPRGQRQPDARNDGWDARRGAVDSTNRRKRREDMRGRAKDTGMKSGKSDRGEEKIHPSWEAAKQRKKNQIKIDMSSQIPTGKKIIF